ncbi:MAG: HAMP domain-containing sensor histidine kinase [Thermodesulfobacteriota bacterium]
MFNMVSFKHFGGGQKGIFLVLRYVFITVAAYLLIFQNPSGQIGTMQAVMIVAALASNLALSAVSSNRLFAWYVEAPVLIADTLWVSWAIHSTGAIGQEFFLLYFFVLFLAATSNSLPMVLFGATFVSAADVYLTPGGELLTTPRLLHIVFFFTVALFYGEVLNQIRRERQRADRGFAWAREIESKVNKRTGALQRMYVDLLVASLARADRTAAACRDLRARLQTMHEDASHLLDPDAPTDPLERGRLLGGMRDGAAALLHVVGTLDGVAGADDTRAHVALQPVRVDNLVVDVQRRERPALNRQVELVWKVDRELPTIESDPLRLRLILDSLIDNAVKFTSKGSITVGVRNLASRREIELRVDDTGIGLDERDLPQLFQPFRRLEEKGDPHARIGIGLALVERLVEQLGGELTVRSTLGRGSSFVVRVPHEPRQAPAAEPEAPGDDAAPAAGASVAAAVPTPGVAA